MPFTPPSNIANAILYWDSDTSQIRTSNSGKGFIGSLGDSVADSAVVDSDQFLFFDWSTQRTKKVTKGAFIETASTEQGAIGTYIVGRPANNTVYAKNTTIAGSSLNDCSTNAWYYAGTFKQTGYGETSTASGSTHSGTWRCMSIAGLGQAYAAGMPGLWVRIS